jgi:hypothetical protein
MGTPLTDKLYLLEKFPGKGGWTYAALPEISPGKNIPFGWVKVRGSIDTYAISGYHLMPMGNGMLFLPVKAEIRKKIQKQEGDTVHIILYAEKKIEVFSEEIIACLKDEPEAFRFFESLTEKEKQQYLSFIDAAKTDQIKVERIARTIELLLLKKKFQ